MKPGSLISGLFDDVREVLQPQAQESSAIFSPDTVIGPMPQPRQFEGRVDQPSNRMPAYEPVEMPSTAPTALQKNSEMDAFPYNRLGLSKDAYDTTVNRAKVFQELVGRWGQESDANRRKELIRQYNGFYDFMGDEAYEDYMNGLTSFDNGTRAWGFSDPAELSNWVRNRIQYDLDDYARRVGVQWYKIA